MPDDYDFIVEHGGRPFLEAGDRGEYVALEAVFREYSDRDNSAEDVAEMFQIRERDVRNGIMYWTSNPDVYVELTEAVQGDERNGGGGLEKSDELSNPLVAARNGFVEVIGYEDSAVSESNIDNFPEENFIGRDMVESHLYWNEDGAEMAVYAGWNSEEGLDIGYVSFSVKGDQGPVLQVEVDEMEERVAEMYRNAVFESRSS